MIQIDIDEIADNITPPRLRSEELQAIVQSFNEPLRRQLIAFYKLVKDKRYELAFTGQVIYLEHLLNDKFNPNSSPKIYITDAAVSSPFYLHNELENKDPVYLYNESEDEDPVYLFNESEFEVGFVVHVPMGVIANWNEFRWWIDKYKLKSKEYTIVEY